MKRYNLESVTNTVAQDHGIVTAEIKMVEDPEGDWVQFEDIQGYDHHLRMVKEQLSIWKRKAGENQLVAGRYQYLFEEAMKAVNKIDDLFEYAYSHMHPVQIKQDVLDALTLFTDAAAKVRKSPTEEQD